VLRIMIEYFELDDGTTMTYQLDIFIPRTIEE